MVLRIESIHGLGSEDMRTAYDAVTPSNIPRNAEVVMGYINGPYAWDQADWDLFPNALKITIATHPDNTTSQIIDYERGDFDDSDVVQAVAVRRSNGGNPIVYCAETDWNHLQAVFASAGVTQPQWLIAAYPGAGDTIPSGAIGHQYIDYQNLYDISVLADFIPGVDPEPTTKENDMPNLLVPAATNDTVSIIVDGCSKLYLATEGVTELTATIYFWGPTPNAAAPANDLLGTAIGPMEIDQVRSGPFPIPTGAVQAEVQYTSNHAWTLGAA
jgi:hypothetical protein